MATPHVRTVHARPTVHHGEQLSLDQPITPQRYIDAGWLGQEFATLWPKVWIFACLEQDVQEAGDFVTFDLGRESILITRADSGELQAFYNVCQHRGARLMVTDFGWVEKFVCPYHGWSYNYSGELVHIPDAERFTPPVDCSKRSLKPVRVASWSGMVWVCMDDNAPSLAEYLGPIGDALAPYRLEAMALTGDQTVQLACNWKAVFDNFGELYHVEHIHPQHEHMFDCPTAEIHLYNHGHTAVIIDGHTVNTAMAIPDTPNPYLAGQLKKFGADPADYEGRVLDIRGDMPQLRRQAGPALGWDYTPFSDERLSDIEQYNIFPNTMITVQPDDALITRARPHPTNPDQCLWDKLTFHRQPDPQVAAAAGVEFAPAAGEHVDTIPRPQHDVFDQEDIIAGRKTMTLTIDQDVHLIRDVQAGMHSRGFDAQHLCDDEIRVQHYHSWLDRWMG